MHRTAGAPDSVLHHPPQAGNHGCRRWPSITPSKSRSARPTDESSSSVRSSVPKPISIINIYGNRRWASIINDPSSCVQIRCLHTRTASAVHPFPSIASSISFITNDHRFKQLSIFFHELANPLLPHLQSTSITSTPKPHLARASSCTIGPPPSSPMSSSIQPPFARFCRPDPANPSRPCSIPPSPIMLHASGEQLSRLLHMNEPGDPPRPSRGPPHGSKHAGQQRPTLTCTIQQPRPALHAPSRQATNGHDLTIHDADHSSPCGN
ncbi:hypothetical protein ACLOJK_004269 [Asimina triloba]